MSSQTVFNTHVICLSEKPKFKAWIWARNNSSPVC